jgi:hypothetical protein
MGNTFGASEGGSEELPTHVILVSSFYMCRGEVTNEKMVEGMEWVRWKVGEI